MFINFLYIFLEVYFFFIFCRIHLYHAYYIAYFYVCVFVCVCNTMSVIIYPLAKCIIIHTTSAHSTSLYSLYSTKHRVVVYTSVILKDISKCSCIAVLSVHVCFPAASAVTVLLSNRLITLPWGKQWLLNYCRLGFSCEWIEL